MSNRTFDERKPTILPEGPAGFYATINFIASALIGYWLWIEGLSLSESLLLPLICVGFVVTRVRFFAVTVLAVLFAVSLRVGFTWYGLLLGDQLFCFLGVVLLLSALRFQALATGVFPKHPFRVRKQNIQNIRDANTFHSSELFAFGVEVVACICIAMLWLLFVNTYSANEVARQYGLLPHGFRAVMLTLSAFLVFVVIHGLLGYGRWARMSRVESMMQLNHEVLRWNRSEEQIIAQRRKRLRKKRER